MGYCKRHDISFDDECIACWNEKLYRQLKKEKKSKMVPNGGFGPYPSKRRKSGDADE